jgi:hypothetical protein
MGYVPGFEHDIFISYAHFDNESTRGRGWVDEFHDALRIGVQQYLGGRISIWRDPKLDGLDIFSDEIEKQVRSSALLLSLFSPSYLNSEWCRREFASFLSTGEFRVANKSRIIKVVKTHVAREQLPAELRNVVGYAFSESDETSGGERSYVSRDRERRSRYFGVLDDLAQDVARLLRILKSETQPRLTAPRGRVYLALTTSDLDEHRLAIKRELEERNYQILPDQLLSPNRVQSEELVRKLVAEADIYVQLLGSYYGASFEDDASSPAQLQYRIAKDLLSERKRGILWTPPGRTITDPRQAELVETIMQELGNAFDFPSCSLQELKALVLDRLEPREEKPLRGATPDQPARVYIMCDKEDEARIKSLSDHLFESKVESLLPVFDSQLDASAIRELHNDHLEVCDAVLIHWGEGSDAWVKSRLNEIRKAPAIRNGVPLRARSVYITDPSNPHKEGFKTFEAKVLRHFGEYSPTVLQDFLAELRGTA